jgi:hypothetical protein
MFGTGVENRVESDARINKEGVSSRGCKIKSCSGITSTKNNRMHTAKISIHWTVIGGMGVEEFITCGEEFERKGLHDK